MSIDRVLNILAFAVTTTAFGLSTRRLVLAQKQVRKSQAVRSPPQLVQAARQHLRRTALFATVSLLASLATASLIVSNPQRPSQAALDSLRVQRTADSLKALQRKMANDSVGAGVSLARSGRLRAAVAKYDAALALDSTNSVAYDLKGFTLFKLARAREAVDVLKRGIAVDSTYPWGYYNLALADWAVGDTAAAAQSIQRLLQLAPEFKETILHDPQFRKLKTVPAIKKVLAESP